MVRIMPRSAASAALSASRAALSSAFSLRSLSASPRLPALQRHEGSAHKQWPSWLRCRTARVQSRQALGKCMHACTPPQGMSLSTLNDASGPGKVHQYRMHALHGRCQMRGRRSSQCRSGGGRSSTGRRAGVPCRQASLVQLWRRSRVPAAQQQRARSSCACSPATASPPAAAAGSPRVPALPSAGTGSRGK